MKTIKQINHTSFGVLRMNNGDVQIHLPKEILHIPLTLESEFKREAALAICPELRQPEKLSDKIFNLANELAVNGFGNDAVKLHQIHNSFIEKPKQINSLENLKPEPSTSLHEIRNKLSPVCHLIAVVEDNDKRMVEFLPDAIKNAKQVVNELAKRQVFKPEPKKRTNDGKKGK